MGAAVSSNVATAVTTVTNNVAQNTSADTEQTAVVDFRVMFNGCTVYGDVEVNNATTVFAQSTQILNAKQDTSLNTDIQQELLQVAESTVGAMGIGYADASNSASMFVSASNTITQSMEAAATQATEARFDFTCVNSTIHGDLTINNMTSIDYFSDQVLDNDQVSDVVNSISQKADQTASATVEGWTSLIIALAILVAAVGYFFTKPLDTAGVKMVIGIAAVVGLFALYVWMAASKLYPFFSDPIIAATAVPKLYQEGASLIDIQYLEQVELPSPPLKYMLPIIQQVNVGGKTLYPLLAMVVSYNKTIDSNNQGYNGTLMRNYAGNPRGEVVEGAYDKWVYDYNYANIGVPQLPNPLYVPGYENNQMEEIPWRYNPGRSDATCTPQIAKYGEPFCNSETKGPAPRRAATYAEEHVENAIAELNLPAWIDYLSYQPGDDDKNKLQRKRINHARFTLCRYLGYINVQTFMDDDDEVEQEDRERNLTTITTAAEVLESGDPQSILRVNFTFPSQSDLITGEYAGLANAVSSTGTATGYFGTVDDTSYQIKKTFQDAKWWLAGGAALLLAGSVVYGGVKKKGSKKKTS